MKALQKASAAGQRVYQITQANMNAVLPLINIDSDAKAEITAALRVGKEVTTHTDAVSIPGGWSGFGYIILDPVTGDGAYKISGGQNGGKLDGEAIGAFSSGFGLFGMILDLKIGLYTKVADANGLSKMANLLGKFSAFMGGIGLLVNLLDLAANCTNTVNVQAIGILLTVLTVVILGLGLLSFGPIFGLILGQMLNQAMSNLIGGFKESSLCK